MGAEEITELQANINESTKTIHDLEKTKRSVEVDRSEIQGHLEEAEAAVESEEGKALRVQVELQQLKQEADRRIAEKDEEIDNARRNATRSVEQIQASLDGEMRARGEATRSRKKMESDMNDLEVQLATTHRQAADAQKITKDYTTQLKDITIKNDDIQRNTEDAREQAAVADRRVTLMATEIEELRNGLEQAERCRKEAAKKALTTAALLAEDLKKETDQTQHLERMKKNQENSVKDLQMRLDEAEQVALKGGKKHQQKLETRCRELEGELESES